MQYLELKNGTKIAFSERYSQNGVTIDIEQSVTAEQETEIRKQLKAERDLVSLKFKTRI